VTVRQIEPVAPVLASAPVAAPSTDPARWRPVDAIPAVLLAAVLLLVWQVGATALAVPRWLLPTPLDVVQAIVADPDLLRVHAARTLLEALVGLTLAAAAGIGIAILMDRWPFARRAFYPVLVGSQTVPILPIAPLLVIWLGYDIAPKLIVVALVCFFPMVVATFDGLGSVDAEMVRLVRSMGASPWQLFWRVRWPGALPRIFSGVRISVTYGITGAIVGEWVGGSRGLGYYMVRASDQLLTERVFAAIAVSAALSIALFLLVVLGERRILPWYQAER
jgi:ABC-type nitrate/sulfonate/bicarbonate transport system permease component